MPVDPLQGLTRDEDRPAGGSEEPRRDVQQGRLPAAGRTDHGDELAALDYDIHVFDRDVVRLALARRGPGHGDAIEREDRALFRIRSPHLFLFSAAST